MDLGSDLDMDTDDEEADGPLDMGFDSAIDMTEDESEDESIDFKLDTDIITDKKEELGEILFDDAAMESPQVMEDDGSDRSADDLSEESEAADLGTISSRQIEDAVERLIQNNYSEKIESIIVNVIEKAVSREIQKLKDALLDDISDIEGPK
jgi:hypothetical protein